MVVGEDRMAWLCAMKSGLRSTAEMWMLGSAVMAGV